MSCAAMTSRAQLHIAMLCSLVSAFLITGASAYSVPDTGQTFCTSLASTLWNVATCPASAASAYFGQDACYTL